jgi:hypothetical protein
MCAAILYHNLTPPSTTLDIPLLGFNWSVLLWLHSCTPSSVTYAWRPAFFISIRYVLTGVKLNWLSRFSFRILWQLFQYVRCGSVLAIVSLSSRNLIVVAEIFECLVLVQVLPVRYLFRYIRSRYRVRGNASMIV